MRLNAEKRMGQILFFVLLLFILMLAVPTTAHACTGAYVGSEVSEDGTIILGKSNDYPDVWPNYVTVVEHVDNMPGRTMPINDDDSICAEIPAETYHYTATPWMDGVRASAGVEKDATVCANECGVSMLMSVTAFTNDAALAADPLIENELTERTAVDLVICQSATAREAVDVLAGIMDTFGSSECNIALIADQNEAWYFEMYTGHQYAAVKLPSDKVCVFGNEFMLEYLSDYESSVVSADLENLAKENGFAQYGPDGELNLFETYSGTAIRTSYSHMRTWIGHQLLAPSQYGADYDEDAFYPLCFDPDHKVSLQEIMELLRNRYEGTEYSPDEMGRTDMRVIGTDTALSVHIVQVYPDLPAEMSCVTWESTAPALYGVFIPVSNASVRVSDAYSRNQPASEYGTFDAAGYPWYAIKALNTLCVEHDSWKVYGVPVRQYWHQAETDMISGMHTVLQNAEQAGDPEVAEAYITDYCCAMQEQAFTDAGKLLNDVMWYKAKNSNTLKNGRNPETHQILDELVVIPPLEITLDGSFYQTVPALPAEG